MISLGSRIKELREWNNFSQEQLAQMLNMSRPTLTQIETDKRPIKTHELKLISEIFDTSIDFLLSGKQAESLKVSKSQKEKFKHLILYILSQVGAKYNVGKVVLYKLLYFSEFDFYELYGEYISGYPFIKLPMWPAPRNFDNIVHEMIEKKELVSFVSEYGKYYQQRYIANTPIKNDRLSPVQKSCVDEILKLYSDMGANEISEESHKDKPRQISNDMSTINYDLVKFREYPYSPLARKQIKTNTQKEAMFSWFFDDLANEPDLYEDYR